MDSRRIEIIYLFILLFPRYIRCNIGSNMYCDVNASHGVDSTFQIRGYMAPDETPFTHNRLIFCMFYQFLLQFPSTDPCSTLTAHQFENYSCEIIFTPYDESKICCFMVTYAPTKNFEFHIDIAHYNATNGEDGGGINYKYLCRILEPAESITDINGLYRYWVAPHLTQCNLVYLYHIQ